MTAPDRHGREGTPVPRRRVAAYRRAAVRRPLAAGVDRLVADLDNLRALAASGSPHARGAGLAAAHGALALAVSPATTEGERLRRRDILDRATAELARADLGHVAALVAAALAHDVGPAGLARGVERPQ